MNGNSESPISLFFCIGRMLTIGPLRENALHHHAGIQIILALEGSFSIRLENGTWQKTKAAILDSHIPHQLKSLSGQQVTISTIPERSRGKKLKSKVLKESTIQLLDSWDLSLYLSKFQDCFSGAYNCHQAFRICEDLIDYLTGSKSRKGTIDQRILLVIYWIQEHLAQPISAAQLAQQIFLSEDRFLHLFKEQVGLPLRQYVLYQRMMMATMIFLSGMNLSAAAHGAGFADSSHFTRTFIEMNGVKPSQIARNKDMYRFCFCSSVCIACQNSTDSNHS